MRDDHGGRWRQLVGASRRSSGSLLDLSASINPLGISPRVVDAIRAAIQEVVHYPEPRAPALVEALARYHGVPVQHVLAGNGSTELIYLLARALAPRRAIVVHPAFSEYEAALEPAGCAIDREITGPETGWAPRLDEIAGRLDRVDLVWLANPGNPTGALLPLALLEDLAERCERAGAVLAIDEAFVDFVEERSLKGEVPRFPRLAVVRSLTKFFALPGLRVGYAILGDAVGERVEAWRQPWSVNALAEAAAIAALADTAYQEETRRLVPEWRAALASGLEKRGFHVHPGAANYLLVRLERGLTGAALGAALLAEGVAIRDCASFPGLGVDHVRIAVPRPDRQQVLFAALDRCLG